VTVDQISGSGEVRSALQQHTKMAPVRTAILVEGLTTKEAETFPMADPQSNAALPAPPLPEGAPPAGVIHVRHRHADRFTVVGNHLAQHPHLSAVAIGLAVHIQSLPDGAPVSVKRSRRVSRRVR
jgi:hypothetical protein